LPNEYLVWPTVHCHR